MKLSFVMPAYKRKYLREAVESILAQTYEDFELVVVDDASPEHLEEVISEFKDPRISYVRNEMNLGYDNLVANWEKAVSFARGEYCVVASDDDIYAPDYAQKMLALAARFREYDVFHCRIGFINRTGRLYKIAEKRPEVEFVPDLMYARGVKRCAQTAPEFMFRTEALTRAGGFVNFPAAWYSDDATWFVLAKERGIVFCDELLFYWRYSGDNISSRFDVIRKKVDAAEAYKVWVRDFIATVSPRSSVDQRVLEYVDAHIYESVDQQTLYDLNDTKFCVWLKIMISHSFPCRLKLRSIRDRIRKVIKV